jgi:hypothetical protein
VPRGAPNCFAGPIIDLDQFPSLRRIIMAGWFYPAESSKKRGAFAVSCKLLRELFAATPLAIFAAALKKEAQRRTRDR